MSILFNWFFKFFRGMTAFRETSIDGAKATTLDRNHVYLFLGGFKNRRSLQSERNKLEKRIPCPQTGEHLLTA